VLLGFLLISALLLYWVPALGLDDASLDRMGGLGLISVLPLPTLIGAALLITVFASLLWMNREHRGLLLITLLATVISLHALPAVIETEPRFATAWQHLGFIDYIDRTGSAVPDLDARWSWPGFFAGAAFVAKACGVSDLTEVIRWWPLTMQLLYLAPTVPARAFDAGELARQVDRHLDLRAERLGGPGLLLPPRASPISSTSSSWRSSWCGSGRRVCCGRRCARARRRSSRPTGASGPCSSWC
jgi:hypothetical protein